MIEITTIAWIAVGLSAGLLHADLLRRATQRLTAWTPFLGMLRMVAVAVVLFVAALAGEILAAASGWAVAFISVSAWLAMSQSNLRPTSRSSASGERGNVPHAP